MENKKHFSKYGLGPVYVATIIAVTAAAVYWTLSGNTGLYCDCRYKKKREKCK